MPKYPYAIYFDSQGEVQKIFPSDLHDINKRAFARSAELFDPDKEYRLFPRYRADSPHFYSLSKSTRYVSRLEETDPDHDNRIDHLLDTLNLGADLSIGSFVWDGDEKQFICLTRTYDYAWGKEVCRVLNSDTKCRHDIFGAPTDLARVDRLPWLAIEVVKHHFPDEQTFSGFLSLSKVLPFVVLFDFIEVPNYFLQVDFSSWRLRVVYYIYDGSVWKNNIRWGETTAGLFREKVQAHIRRVQKYRKRSIEDGIDAND